MGRRNRIVIVFDVTQYVYHSFPKLAMPDLFSCRADVPGHPEIEDEYRETCLEIQRNCEIYNQEFSIGRRHRRTAGS